MKQAFQYIKNRLIHYRGPYPLKVIITGPPRSGTSFLSGLVVRMGFSPGPKEWLKKADQYNPHGYYECAPLLKIDHDLLKRFGGSPMDPPQLPENWTNLCEKEKKQIRGIVTNGGIEVYKGNMLVVLADLYDELFPGVKWIMIYRSEEETVRSIVDAETPIPAHKLVNTRDRWLKNWEKSRPSSHCLTVRYEDFIDNTQQAISAVADYLGVTLTEEKLRECNEFFKPGAARNLISKAKEVK
jgi:hypothetical protein